MKLKNIYMNQAAVADGSAAGAGAPAAGASATAVLTQAAATPTGDAASGTPAQPTGDASNQPWYHGHQSAEVKTWLEAKGFKDPLAVADSAYNLEKLMGFDKAGRTVVVPKDDAKPEEIAAFNAKMGVPAKAEDYKLPVPTGDDGAFAKTASTWMHEAGIPAKAAEKLATKWNEFQVAQAQAAQDKQAAQGKIELDELNTEWGSGATQMTEFGRRFARNFIPAENDEKRAEIMTKIEGAIGPKMMMKIFAEAGKGLGEHKVVGGGGGDNNILTPAQALQKIAQLKSDATWSAAYLAGDKAKFAEMENLSKIAVSGQQS